MENGISGMLFLRQKMQSIDLYGTIDTCICTLDSINHITDIEDVQKTFSKVSFFMNPQALFIFDVNTVYKHQQILAYNTFVYDTEMCTAYGRTLFAAIKERLIYRLIFLKGLKIKRVPVTDGSVKAFGKKRIQMKKYVLCLIRQALSFLTDLRGIRSKLPNPIVRGLYI